MIARIEGKLLKLTEASCLIQVGQIGYEIMLAGYCVAQLANSIGNDITLCSMEYYEGTPGGGNLIPRLVGFLSDSERDFFHKFTSVKGIGIKKGLKALTIPMADIALAIESEDEKILMSLPGLGKRMAQHIVAELNGKLKSFAANAEGNTNLVSNDKFQSFQTEALEILIAWGEKRNDSIEMISLACKKHPDVDSAEELVRVVYRLKQGFEV